MDSISQIAFELAQALCKSLDLETGLNSFFASLEKHFPILSITFGRFDESSQSLFLLSYTDKQATKLILKKIPFTQEQIDIAINTDFYNIKNAETVIADAQHPFAKLYQCDIVPTSFPLFSLRIPSNNKFYAGAVFTFHENMNFDEKSIAVIKLLEPTLRIFISSFMRYWELEELKDKIYQENIQLRQEIAGALRTEVIGASGGLSTVMKTVKQIAPLDISVLINGETGTGKEVLAKAIYELSPRNNKSFITINCAAIPPALIDNELFGHEKGAFTGANTSYKGRFERASGGIIFLDEIAELPLDVQARLLRVLQERVIERIGSHKAIAVDFRLIAATHKNLSQMVSDGTFREDLYYRLNVASITLPPLRERKQDIPVLTKFFLSKAASRFGMHVAHISQEELAKLMYYDFPGNIRELQNILELALATCTGGEIIIPPLGTRPQASKVYQQEFVTPYEAMQKKYLQWALTECNHKVRGSKGAAELLELPHGTLRSKLKKYGII